MELKQNQPQSPCKQQPAFNRTIVELKQNQPQSPCKQQPAFNRTIVELKLRYYRAVGFHTWQLLIGPLWNWNSGYSMGNSKRTAF